MNRKPTHASVTSKVCSCNYLQNAAADLDSPIVWDETTGEFQFTYPGPDGEGPSMLILYHCPFCGGAAPESRRSQLFAVISRDEESRLAGILKPIRTIEDAFAALGPPDFDSFSTIRTPESDVAPPTVQRHRTIRYKNLSSVAEIWITERPDGKVCWQLQGKPLER